MQNNKKIQVGIDFDGVLAYNPFRVARAPVTFVKRKIFGAKKTQFYIPKTSYEKFIWGILHESSIFPAEGVELLKKLVEENKIEAHLVTARFGYLQNSLYKWLQKNDLEKLFTSITINMKDEQPHLYKNRIILEKKFDYFIDDNWDIVKHLKDQKDTQVLWIYNIVDRWNPYELKYPYLRRALEAISSEKNLA